MSKARSKKAELPLSDSPRGSPEDPGMPDECELKADVRCRRCHRALTNPASRAKGFGPICIVKESGDGMQAEEPAEAAT